MIAALSSVGSVRAGPATRRCRLGDTCELRRPRAASGGVCDYTAAVPICIDANADTDGDGIPNALDHCPDGPGGMYDEDGDGIGDECDKCPIAKPPCGSRSRWRRRRQPVRSGSRYGRRQDPAVRRLQRRDARLAVDGRCHGRARGRSKAASSSCACRRRPTQAYLDDAVIPEPNLAVADLVSRRQASRPASTDAQRVDARGAITRPAGVPSSSAASSSPMSAPSGEVVDLETDQATVSTSHRSCRVRLRSPLSQRRVRLGQHGRMRRDRRQHAARGGAECDHAGCARHRSARRARAVTARFQWVLVIGRSNTLPPPP